MNTRPFLFEVHKSFANFCHETNVGMEFFVGADSYQNFYKAQDAAKYRAFLPTFFYPDYKGGGIDVAKKYWRNYGIIGSDNFNVRYKPKPDWVFFSYQNGSHLNGFDTRSNVTRTLNIRFSTLSEYAMLATLAVAATYQSYIEAPLYYTVNGSRTLKDISFLKLELKMRQK